MGIWSVYINSFLSINGGTDSFHRDATSEFLLRNDFGGKVPANRRHCRCSMRYDVHLSFLQQSEFFFAYSNEGSP